jgi:hypothetical protein
MDDAPDMTDHRESRLQRLLDVAPGPWTRRVRNVLLSILVPPVAFVLILLLPASLRNYGDIPLEFGASLLIGWAFLFREFRIYAVLLCWAYFVPMWWVTVILGVFFGPFVWSLFEIGSPNF